MPERLSHKADTLISESTCLADLPIDKLKTQDFPIYVIDYDWVYLFANDCALKQFGETKVVGRNIKEIWRDFPNINFTPVYNMLKDAVAEKRDTVIKYTSPLSNKSVALRGIALNDCYYLSVTVLPDRESLLTELKSFLKKG